MAVHDSLTKAEQRRYAERLKANAPWPANPAVWEGCPNCGYSEAMARSDGFECLRCYTTTH
jgi:hypothetical protein